MKKIVIRVLIAVLIVGSVYSILWYTNYNSYEKYITLNVAYSSGGGYLMEDEEKSLLYYVKKPSLFSFTGNLVGQTEDDSISIILWPSFLCNDISEIGVVLKDNTKQEAYFLCVDKDMNLSESQTTGLDMTRQQTAEAILKSRKDVLVEIYKNIIDKYGLEND